MKDRIKALLLALAMVVTFGSCKEESLEESIEPVSTSTIESDTIETAVIGSEAPLESKFVEIEDPAVSEEVNLDASVEVSEEVSRYAICEEIGLNAPTIQNELEKIEKGEPFQFTYVTEGHETHSHYGIMGPMFKQIEKNGKKCLVYADDENNILLSGYDFLGLPFYVLGYDQSNGGSDKESEYSGWVIPTYTYTEGDSLEMLGYVIPEYTFDLYDFEDFHLLLKDCTPDSEFENHGTNWFGTTGPIFVWYFSALDPIYDGYDDVNSATGYAVVIKKDGLKYLVDANDFTKVYFDNFTGLESYGNAIIFKNYRDNDNGRGYKFKVSAKDLKPYYSDILIKDRRK